MKKIKVELSVPDVFITAHRAIKQAWGWAKWRTMGPRCAVTGELLFTANADIMSYAQGHRVMFTTAGHESEPLGIEGLLVRITHFWERDIENTVSPAVEETKCDCCGKQKRTINIIWSDKAAEYGLNLNVRFGMAWWNGFHLCYDCIQEALTNPEAHESYSMTIFRKGKIFACNKYGYEKEASWG